MRNNNEMGLNHYYSLFKQVELYLKLLPNHVVAATGHSKLKTPNGTGKYGVFDIRALR